MTTKTTGTVPGDQGGEPPCTCSHPEDRHFETVAGKLVPSGCRVCGFHCDGFQAARDYRPPATQGAAVAGPACSPCRGTGRLTQNEFLCELCNGTGKQPPPPAAAGPARRKGSFCRGCGVGFVESLRGERGSYTIEHKQGCPLPSTPLETECWKFTERCRYGDCMLATDAGLAFCAEHIALPVGGWEVYDDPHTGERLFRPRIASPPPPASEPPSTPEEAAFLRGASLSVTKMAEQVRLLRVDLATATAAKAALEVQLRGERAAHARTTELWRRDEEKGIAAERALRDERDAIAAQLKNAAADLGRAADWLEQSGLGVSGEATRASQARAALAASGPAKEGPPLFYLLSEKWTDFDYITWWRPDSRGYTRRLPDAGKYTREEARKIAHYSVIPVPCEEAEALEVRVVPLDERSRKWLRVGLRWKRMLESKWARENCHRPACSACNGKKGRWDDEAIDQWYPCERCNETGREPDEFAAPPPREGED